MIVISISKRGIDQHIGLWRALFTTCVPIPLDEFDEVAITVVLVGTHLQAS
jgi:hypothetical protein